MRKSSELMSVVNALQERIDEELYKFKAADRAVGYQHIESHCFDSRAESTEEAEQDEDEEV